MDVQNPYQMFLRQASNTVERPHAPHQRASSSVNQPLAAAFDQNDRVNPFIARHQGSSSESHESDSSLGGAEPQASVKEATFAKKKKKTVSSRNINERPAGDHLSAELSEKQNDDTDHH